MSVEEMTRYLLAPWTERGMHLEDVDKRILKIIAQLKAGQEMRQAFHIEEYYDVLGNKKEELDVDMEKAEGAVEAWDAVTKDNV